MSLDEQAQQVSNTLDQIEGYVYNIRKLCSLVLLQEKVDGETIQLSDEQKQKIIQAYQTKKTELEALVEALP